MSYDTLDTVLALVVLTLILLACVFGHAWASGAL